LAIELSKLLARDLARGKFRRRAALNSTAEGYDVDGNVQRNEVQESWCAYCYMPAIRRISKIRCRSTRSWRCAVANAHRLKFRGILLVTRKEGEVGTLHMGMGTINADQTAATSLKTRDALIKRHAVGKNPGGTAYGYKKRIAYDLNGERTKGLQQIVPAQATIVVRIFEDYAAGISPGSIVRRLNEEGVPPPRSGRRDRATSSNPPA
jgi:hypothetical protein